jgi:hypothetical protein
MRPSSFNTSSSSSSFNTVSSIRAGSTLVMPPCPHCPPQVTTATTAIPTLATVDIPLARIATTNFVTEMTLFRESEYHTKKWGFSITTASIMTLSIMILGFWNVVILSVSGRIDCLVMKTCFNYQGSMF